MWLLLEVLRCCPCVLHVHRSIASRAYPWFRRALPLEGYRFSAISAGQFRHLPSILVYSYLCQLACLGTWPGDHAAGWEVYLPWTYSSCLEGDMMYDATLSRVEGILYVNSKSQWVVRVNRKFYTTQHLWTAGICQLNTESGFVNVRRILASISPWKYGLPEVDGRLLRCRIPLA